jgi:hypothetical protein
MLPVSTETIERSFSILITLKNDMRSTMTESRLNGFTLLNVQKNLFVDIDVVSSKTKKNRNF